MAKLTRIQRARIESALHHLQRADTYLQSERIVIAAKTDRATTTLHYTHTDGSALYPLAKDIGSDLTGLAMGIADLVALLVTSAK